MRMYSIASGSSGNCIYVGTEKTHLLVDAGISGKRTEQGLRDLSVNPANISGILITHEHIDHIHGLGVMMRRYRLPVYAVKETIEQIFQSKRIGQLDESLFHEISPDQGFCIQDIEVMPIHVSHDAVNPVCYTFRQREKKIGIATDLGVFDEYTVKRLLDCDVLLLESNHDRKMLEIGTYPYELKCRILGKRGHLSNESAAKLLSFLVGGKLKHIILGHLSEENNLPELAYWTVKQELDTLAGGVFSESRIQVADRKRPSCYVSV